MGNQQNVISSARLVKGAVRRLDRKRRHLAHRGIHAAGGVRRTVERGVALTFDDGPDPVHTGRILDVLGAHDAVATFFLVGSHAAAHPELVERMVAEGHAIGSHTTSHPDLWTLRSVELHREIRNGHRTVEALAGRRTSLFRPPKGHIDLRVAAAARRCGLHLWLWSVDPADWAPGAATDDIVAAVRPGSGDVVLLHDRICLPLDPSTLDRTPTVTALAGIIEDVRSRGLPLVTLPDGQGRR